MGDSANGVTLVALFSLNVQVLTDNINDNGIQVRCCVLAEELSCHAILPYTLGGLKRYQAASASHKDYMMEPLHIRSTRVGLQASTYKDMISCISLWLQEGCLKWTPEASFTVLLISSGGDLGNHQDLSKSLTEHWPL